MPWNEKCYSRFLVDQHITDLKPEYMSHYDPEKFVNTIKDIGLDSVMVYACCHNGNCYYPTRCGHQHRGLKGRDIFGETVQGLRDAGIVPIAYYTVIFHNDSARRFPHGVPVDKNGSVYDGRYHFGCPNNPDIADFYMEQLREISQYPIEGIFIDMTYWPAICCCESCREKFRKETGFEIPEIINWSDPLWLKYQQFRENSMAEFAKKLTMTVKEIKPECTVTHQFSPVLHGWRLGQSTGIAEASDYVTGDFYGGKQQQRLALKLFDAYSTHKPSEFMTSRCVTLKDHTSTKSDDELYLHALTTLANGSAYFFIDALNPDGSLEQNFYQRIKKINQELLPFKEMIAHHRPELCAEVGVYFAIESCVNLLNNGVKTKNLKEVCNNMAQRSNPVVEELLGITGLLQNLHIPYKFITERQEDYSSLKVLIVANANHLKQKEYNKMRKFVQDGGLLIVTGHTSLCSREEKYDDFQLGDLFGIRYSGKNTESFHYLVMPDSLISATSIAPLATATTAKVHGYVNLPDFSVNDPVHYASIHSNPPGETSGFAGFTENDYGKGKCFWFYSNILGIKQFSQQDFGRKFLKHNLPAFVTESKNLPYSTEITLLKSTTEDAWLFTVVNYQDELPNIPLKDVSVTLRIPESRSIREIIQTSDGKKISFQQKNDLLSFEIPYLEKGEFFIIRGNFKSPAKFG